MKRLLTLAFFCTICSLILAQKITIDWKGTTVVDYGSSQVTLPYFSNAGFAYENHSLVIRVTQPYTGSLKTVSNLVWEAVSPSALYDLNAQFLPEDEITDIAVNKNPFTGARTTSILVNTFRKENGKVYRLSSFTITDQSTARGLAEQIPAPLGTTDNPLKTGTFYKIKVDKSGIFKITSKFLRDNGINPANINLQNFRIYGNGGLMLPEHNLEPRYGGLQEMAIQISDAAATTWTEDTFALFYAQGPHGFHVFDKNSPGRRKQDLRNDKPDNFINIYDDYAYYFINFDLGPGKRVPEAADTAGGPLITRYDDFQFVNEEKYNLLKLGRIWTGDIIKPDQVQTFTTREPLQPTDEVKYRTRVIAFQSQGNKISIGFTGAETSSHASGNSAGYPFASPLKEGTVTGVSGNTLTFTYNPDTSANPTGNFYFDYAEVSYPQNLTFNGSQMSFRKFNLPSGNATFVLSNAGTAEQVWDVSDLTNAVRTKNNSGTAGVHQFNYNQTETFPNEFVAFRHQDAYAPQFVGRIDNQDLAGLSGIDYVMITQPEMLGQAQRLADYYKDQFSVAVAVVDVNKIYNEYSSGRKDLTAIRDFITQMHGKTPLQYVFLLGDTSFDFRGRIYPGSDIIPSYQSEESGSFSTSFVTDDYFVMTEPQTNGSIMISNQLPDIPIGRLPASNISEAKLLIDKTLAYYNALPGQSTPFGEWRMKLDFVVDDDKDAGTPFHETMEETLKAEFEQGTRSEYNVRKLYIDAFPAETAAGGQRYPAVNQAISNDMGNTLYMFYFGHGGINGWAQERILTIDMIRNFRNYNNVYSRLPLVSTITCEFTLWDEPGTFSAGEQVIKSNEGGAATMITSSRAIGVGYGESFTKLFTTEIFRFTNNNDFDTLGNAFLEAKEKKGTQQDHLRVNFLGDPAMKLARPTQNIVINEIIADGQSSPDKLRALDFVTVKGIVTKADGTTDSDFTGRIAVNVFDKKVKKKTLNNDGGMGVMEFQEEPGTLVKSSAEVVNGEFTVEFYMPKDINYTDGNGRILLYADNKKFDVFTNKVQKIGGINPNGIDDKEAPKVKLYMNNTNFADGGITDQNPTLLACVSDNTGINSTGAGIGHDITVVLDGKIIDTSVLNDFYFSGDNNGCLNPSLKDYQKGAVSYPFRNLSPGEHQLSFKVWDINNNSTTATLNFIVQDEADRKLVLNRLLNWPNPFTSKTYVHFEHNCDDMLDVHVQIFTITGKLVRTLNTTVTAEPFFQGYRTPRTAIEWDGTDDFGDTVGKGTYIFKVFARSQNQDKCPGSATAVEKMVLLK